MSAPSSPPALPARLGRYEVQALLGRGAMGSVYKAHDPSLDRVVAVKTLGGLLPEKGELREEYLARFQREARAAARLSHPNIVAVYDLDVDEPTGAPFIVMEYVPGVSLATVLRERPELPIAQALEMVEQVAAALEEAHRQGIVHRDVKPANVFVDPRGRLKVGDFGIARVEGSELTQAGITLGTPGYLAPEVLRGARADARADVFALGALAYTLLAGRKPFLGVTPEVLVTEVLEREPEPPHAVRAEVPAAASAAVMHALAKDPQARTPSVEAFRGEMAGAAAVAALPPTDRVATAIPAAAAGPTLTVATAARPRRRMPVWLGLAGAALVLMAAWLAWMGLGNARDEAGRAPAAPAAAPTAAPGVKASSAPSRPRPTATPPPRRAVEEAGPERPPEREVSRVPPGHRRDKEARPGRGKAKGNKKKQKD